jgi:hypothetical protein
MRSKARLGSGVAAALLAAEFLAGCVHSGAPTPLPSSNSTGGADGAPTASAPATPGEFVRRSAKQWAGRISGCVQVASVPLARLGSVAPVAKPLAGHGAEVTTVDSVASCSAEDHPIVVLAFANPDREGTARSRLRQLVPVLATGPGWVAIAAHPDSSAQAQSVVEGIAGQLGGEVLHGTGGAGNARAAHGSGTSE